ncbi:transposase [Bacillus sp. B-jedd]|uniref:transposase n=1 Tax=Bacillus sp. B-jedd TaxID=1476857 RepID=UPI00051566A3|nr:transposase [Bacillus sp. B-jedd]CEG27023.1 putative transposase [Bacillus sp. B-jedd]
MPRKNRVWLPGAIYHITCRGIRRTVLFHDDCDREMYLLLLQTAMKRFQFRLHAYCLMPNHIHMQLESGDDPPCKILQYMNSVYAIYFNKKYQHSGHVFEKRFYAVLVEGRKYELELSRYIHLNPVKAGLTDTLDEYVWSSYPTYSTAHHSPFVTTRRLLSYFKNPHKENYLKFIAKQLTNPQRKTKTAQVKKSPVRLQ